MIDLLRVYVCPKCGDVLEDEVSWQEAIDAEADDVSIYWLHDKCGHEAVPKVGPENTPVFEQVDHERWLWAQGFHDVDCSGESDGDR